MTEQYTDAWFRERLGKVTASRVADVGTRTKTGWGAGRANYAAQLIAERLTGEAQESYSSPAMQRGLDMEPTARAAYEFYCDVTVEPVGFVPHPTIPMSGASPDGLIGQDGLCEIKCPNTATHIATLRTQKVEGKYLTQMQWQMACTCRQWCDFASFDPRMPEGMSLFVKRVPRDAERIAELETLVTAFLAEVDTAVADLRRMYQSAEREAA